MRVSAPISWVAAMLGLAASAGVHGEAAELIHFHSPTQTIATAPEAQEVIATYRFTNVTTGTLTISAIESPCECISAHWDRRLYQAGESGDVVVVLGIGERSGHLAKQILVKTEPSTDQPVTLTLMADIP